MSSSIPPNSPTSPTSPTSPEERTQGESSGAEATAKVRISEVQAKAKTTIAETEAKVKAKVRDTEAKVRHQVDEVQRTVGGFEGLSDPSTATSVDEAVGQADDLRRAIDRDLDVLQARLPPGDELAQKAKTVGGAALGVVGVIAAVTIAMKKRGERKRVERDARAHAAAIARYLPGASARPAPDPSDGGGNKGKVALLLLVGAGVAAVVASRASGGDASGDSGGDASDGVQGPDVWGPPA